jgi:hypothetical protein
MLDSIREIVRVCRGRYVQRVCMPHRAYGAVTQVRNVVPDLLILQALSPYILRD